MDDPVKILTGFLSGLPLTIREGTLAIILLAFDAYPLDDMTPDLSPIVTSLLTPTEQALASFKVALVAGVTEVALADAGWDKEAFFNRLTAEKPSKLFARQAAAAPLEERHREAAREAFARLREGPLSPQSLRRWREPQQD